MAVRATWAQNAAGRENLRKRLAVRRFWEQPTPKVLGTTDTSEPATALLCRSFPAPGGDRHSSATSSSHESIDPAPNPRRTRADPRRPRGDPARPRRPAANPRRPAATRGDARGDANRIGTAAGRSAVAARRRRGSAWWGATRPASRRSEGSRPTSRPRPRTRSRSGTRTWPGPEAGRAGGRPARCHEPRAAPRPAPVAHHDGAAATGRRLCFVSSQSYLERSLIGLVSRGLPRIRDR